MNEKTNEEELWKPIEGFENYEISSLGRVRKTFFLKINPNQIGYVYVALNGKSYSLHRLVAKHFPEICGEYSEWLEIDHLNTIKTDNRAANLRVCTPKENRNNPLTKEKYKTRSSKDNRRNAKPVIAIRVSDGKVERYESKSDAALKIKGDRRHRSSIINSIKNNKVLWGRIWKNDKKIGKNKNQ